MQYKLLKESIIQEMVGEDDSSHITEPQPVDETCSFKDFKRFAKSLGYRVSSSVTDFGGFGYGSARFYKIFHGDRRVQPLNPKKRDSYVTGWWDRAMSMDKEIQEFIISHKIIDDDGCKCIPAP